MNKLTSPAAALLQLAVMSAAAAAATLLPLLLPAWNAPLRAILQWTLLPLLGGFTAGLLARAGVTCYLAWILPPVLVSAVPWLIIGYPFAPGVMLLCALVSMVGAAAGEVARRRAGRQNE